MTVGIARLALFIGASHSLKEKRMVLRRVKDLVRQKFNVSIAEVAENDVWQRAVLGIAVVGNDRRYVEGALDEVIGFVRGKADVTGEERELQTFNDARSWWAPTSVTGKGRAGRCRSGPSELPVRCAPSSVRCWRARRSRTRACVAPGSSR